MLNNFSYQKFNRTNSSSLSKHIPESAWHHARATKPRFFKLR